MQVKGCNNQCNTDLCAEQDGGERKALVGKDDVFSAGVKIDHRHCGVVGHERQNRSVVSPGHVVDPAKRITRSSKKHVK